ncbi:MAG: 16S rRNA (adenine(1518)-N(6)/adenine(1519)-N(6))-dimethyltransferase RsmA [Myxococcota bacterium]
MSVARVREVLERHGLALSRDRGQNFLVDDSLAERLARLSGAGPGDSVIEVGTGLGILTRALAARGARVVTLEIDAGVVRALRAESLLPGSVRLMHEDALAVDWDVLVDEAAAAADAGRVRVVANLPYSVATPLLRRWLDLRERLVDWSVMVQREMAARLTAPVGTRDYGSLAVLHHLCVRARRETDVNPRAFFPPPRVASSFVRITPRSDDPLGEGELRQVERLARAGFGTRRKTLANALRTAGLCEATLEALSTAGIDPRARAESVAPERWLALARAVAAASEQAG